MGPEPTGRKWLALIYADPMGTAKLDAKQVRKRKRLALWILVGIAATVLTARAGLELAFTFRASRPGSEQSTQAQFERTRFVCVAALIRDVVPHDAAIYIDDEQPIDAVFWSQQLKEMAYPYGRLVHDSADADFELKLQSVPLDDDCHGIGVALVATR